MYQVPTIVTLGNDDFFLLNVNIQNCDNVIIDENTLQKMYYQGNFSCAFWFNLACTYNLVIQRHEHMKPCFQLLDFQLEIDIGDIYITNLTSHDLVMEIVQNSFIHNSNVPCTNIVHRKLTHIFIRRCEICVTFVHS